jgi:probable phosphoglycerate mutase
MNRPALLVLVRHAESARNVAKKGNTFFLDDESRKAVRGVPDDHVPLTDEGRRQAEVTGRALRAEFGAFDYVCHSGYRRTQETAEQLLAAYTAEERAATKLRHHLFLRERDAGWTYDMTTAEAEAAFPWLEAYWDTFGNFFARPPGGESLADVAQRVYLFLGMLFRERAGQRVLLVSHAGTLRVLRFLLEKWTYDDFLVRFGDHVPNCSVSSYAYDETAGRLAPQQVNVVHWGAAETT